MVQIQRLKHSMVFAIKISNASTLILVGSNDLVKAYATWEEWRLTYKTWVCMVDFLSKWAPMKLKGEFSPIQGEIMKARSMTNLENNHDPSQGHKRLICVLKEALPNFTVIHHAHMRLGPTSYFLSFDLLLSIPSNIVLSIVFKTRNNILKYIYIYTEKEVVWLKYEVLFEGIKHPKEFLTSYG